MVQVGAHSFGTSLVVGRETPGGGIRGSNPTWFSPLPPPSALRSAPGRMRGSGGGFLDFFPDPPEDPVDPVGGGGGGTEVGVCCDMAEAKLDRRRRRGRYCQAPSETS